MSGKVLVSAAVSAALLVGSSGCTASSSSPNASPPPASLPGQQASASSPPPSVALETTCALGFYDGRKLAPLTASNDQLPSAAKVTVTNPAGTAVSLGGLVINMWHENHVFLLSHDAADQLPHLPFRLAPGERYSAVIQFNLLVGEGAVSFSTYLHATCTISTWSVY